MERGSVHDILLKKQDNLTWDLRFKIAIGAAEGLYTVFLFPETVLTTWWRK